MERLKVHIRHVMLWEFKQGNNATETDEEICSVYGEGTITDRAVWNWFVKFRSGDTSLKDEPRPGCSSDFDDDALKALVKCSPCQSTWKLADKLNTSQSTICHHLESQQAGCLWSTCSQWEEQGRSLINSDKSSFMTEKRSVSWWIHYWGWKMDHIW